MISVCAYIYDKVLYTDIECGEYTKKKNDNYKNINKNKEIIFLVDLLSSTQLEPIKNFLLNFRNYILKYVSHDYKNMSCVEKMSLTLLLLKEINIKIVGYKGRFSTVLFPNKDETFDDVVNNLNNIQFDETNTLDLYLYTLENKIRWLIVMMVENPPIIYNYNNTETVNIVFGNKSFRDLYENKKYVYIFDENKTNVVVKDLTSKILTCWGFDLKILIRDNENRLMQIENIGVMYNPRKYTSKYIISNANNCLNIEISYTDILSLNNSNITDFIIKEIYLPPDHIMDVELNFVKKNYAENIIAIIHSYTDGKIFYDEMCELIENYEDKEEFLPMQIDLCKINTTLNLLYMFQSLTQTQNF